MQIRLLGPVELVDDRGEPVALTGVRERVLLATLALSSSQVVSTDRLIDVLWGEDPPATAKNSLAGHVSRLRKKLAGPGEGALIESGPSSYRLVMTPQCVDAHYFEKLAGATANHPEETSAQLREALSLWRGPALSDVGSDAFVGERARLDELRLVVLERAIDAELNLGRHAELIPEIEALVHDHPLRERLWGQLILALYRAGRQSEALRAYGRVRRILKEELGIEPSEELVALDEAILLHKPELHWVAVPPDEPSPGAVRERPTGVVTLLLTDIVSSTRHWEREPDAMADALHRHDTLIYDAVTQHRGAFLQARGEGDSTFSVFTRASDAIAAAFAAQRELALVDWPLASPLTVRMAVHTGEAVEEDGDYHGPTVNRAARLRTIADGGQILVSAPTAEVVRDRLPPGARLADLGRRKLKDLAHPEHVFLLFDNESAPSFIPRSSEHNLPMQLTRFIGREADIAAVASLLETSRLVTLTGAGGSGKTRLALQVAATALEHFTEGVWLVELASLDHDRLLVGALSSVLRVREEAGRQLLETVAGAISDKHMLLILDNCEHLIDACAETANSLLRSCPRLSILTTSREPLGILGEHVYRVPSLSLPPADDSLVAASAERFEAVRLFADRARAVQSTFELDDSNVETVASICRHLDGMPLAIELATARLSSLSPDEIDMRLDRRFRLLTGKVRGVLPRHQTLGALIDWSHDLLDDNEQATLARLSTFAGGWTLEAAEAVCYRTGTLERDEVVGILHSLVDKNLVQVEPVDWGIRYGLLETVRQYAAERLAERGDDETLTRERHAQFFLELVEAAGPYLSGSAKARWWFDRLQTDHDNVRTALSQLISSPSTIDQALRIGIALRDFWFAGMFTQGIEAFQPALSTSFPSDQALRAAALIGIAYLNAEQGNYAAAQAQFEEAAYVASSIQDSATEAEALGGLSLLALRRGDTRSAMELAETSIDLARRAGVPFVLADALNHRGAIRSASGDSDCRADFDESLDLFRRIDNLDGVRRVLQSLAILALKQGDLTSARAHIEESLDLTPNVERDARASHASLNLLGLLELFDGNIPTARDVYRELLVVAHRLGVQPFIAYAFLGLGFCAGALGDFSRAIRIHGAADQLFERIGERLEPDLEAYRQHEHRRLRRMVAEDFEALYLEGRGLATRDTIVLAMNE